MKAIFFIILAIFVAIAPVTSYAAKGGKKGPSDKAYEKASDNASFKREEGKGKKEKKQKKEGKEKKDKNQTKEKKQKKEKAGTEEKEDKEKEDEKE